MSIFLRSKTSLCTKYLFQTAVDDEITYDLWVERWRYLLIFEICPVYTSEELMCLDVLGVVDMTESLGFVLVE